MAFGVACMFLVAYVVHILLAGIGEANGSIAGTNRGLIVEINYCDDDDLRLRKREATNVRERKPPVGVPETVTTQASGLAHEHFSLPYLLPS